MDARPASGGGGPWRWLALLSLAEVLTMLTFASYSAALPVLRRQWQMSASQAGTVFAGQQLGYAAAVLALSTLTDVVGVRAIYLAGALWNAVASALFAVAAGGFGSALVLRALAGAGLAGTYVPGMRLVVEAFPAARRGAAMGIYIACFSVGASLSLLLTGLLLRAGWRLAFAVASAGPLLAAVVAFRIVRDPPRAPASLRMAAAGVWRNVRALRLITAYAAHNWELFGMRAWLPAFLTTLWAGRGLSLEAAASRGATFASLVLLAGAASNAAGGWLSDHLGRRRTIVLFLSASAACSAIIGWTPPLGAAAVLALAVIYGLLVTAESSTLSTAVAESAAPHSLGATLAAQSAVGFVATAISPPSSG
ncbi:MAG: MFS transporter [Armatimonadota bacterium]|nr:MFS transporter [Armatimonadota bacterium]